MEAPARQHGRSTLVLDALQSAGPGQLYQALGYVAVGAVPPFARVPGGALAATVVYHALLASPLPQIPVRYKKASAS